MPPEESLLFTLASDFSLTYGIGVYYQIFTDFGPIFVGFAGKAGPRKRPCLDECRPALGGVPGAVVRDHVENSIRGAGLKAHFDRDHGLRRILPVFTPLAGHGRAIAAMHVRLPMLIGAFAYALARTGVLWVIRTGRVFV